MWYTSLFLSIPHLISCHLFSHRILITDARDTLNNTLRYYGTLDGSTGAHLPLNYRLQDIVPGTSSGDDVKEVVDVYLSNLPGQATADWLVSAGVGSVWLWRGRVHKFQAKQREIYSSQPETLYYNSSSL